MSMTADRASEVLGMAAVWNGCGRATREELREAISVARKILRENAEREKKPRTNADHIRAMSVEELAKFIPNWSCTNACKCSERYVDCNNECEECVIEWLRQPVTQTKPIADDDNHEHSGLLEE